jgi:hypothetical protein
MGLGLKIYHNDGNFVPRLEFNAKVGRLTSVDRTADGTETTRIDITMQKVLLAFDVGSIEIGWINFQSGAAPSFDMVPYGQSMPARPDRNHKAGFRSRLWDGRAGFSREFSSTAGATVNAIEALWDALIEAPEAGAGQVPVIQLMDAVPITMQRGTNYAPLFKLVCWVERDEMVFGPRTVAPPGGAPIVVPASPSSHNLASVATPHAWSALTPSVQAPTNAWPVAA